MNRSAMFVYIGFREIGFRRLVSKLKQECSRRYLDKIESRCLISFMVGNYLGSALCKQLKACLSITATCLRTDSLFNIQKILLPLKTRVQQENCWLTWPMMVSQTVNRRTIEIDHIDRVRNKWINSRNRTRKAYIMRAIIKINRHLNIVSKSRSGILRRELTRYSK